MRERERERGERERGERERESVTDVITVSYFPAGDPGDGVYL